MEGEAAVKVHRHEVVMTGLCKTRFVGLHLGFADSAMGSLHLLTSGSESSQIQRRQCTCERLPGRSVRKLKHVHSV